MPVNTATLKTFAPAMRRQLLEAVGRKLDLLLHSQTPDTLSTYAKQIAELREQEAENREQVLERVAYTWFNRLCALRYLDARAWHPFGCKVLMPAGEGETQPELLKLMRAGSLPAELKSHTNEARLHGLLDGQIPPAMAGSDPQGEVYRELVLASCRSYHQLLPNLFEGLDDASELLLPDDMISEGSIAGGFRTAISDEDCEDVEIIGWLYQFYISEKKDQVIGKVVKSEDIPAATQLFTPNWIVKYMVQNTLGATWLATYPDSPLKGQMEFYIEPAEQTPAVQAKLAAITPESLDPETLTLIDPACGSGHILVEAYELLKAIYLERGYQQRDIPGLILTKNLYGLDICPRATQLAAFSLLMKGREDDRRLLERGIQLDVMALHDSTAFNVEQLAASVDLATAGISYADVRVLVELFNHATTFGSLLKVPTALVDRLPALSRFAETCSLNLLGAGELNQLALLARQAVILAQRYDIVVANPPYMGGGAMTKLLKGLTSRSFPVAKGDLFACFVERSYSLVAAEGLIGMVTMQSWMFLSSFEGFRERILLEKTIETMVHIGYNSFPSMNSKVALATAFTLRNSKCSDFKGCFTDLNSASQSSDKEAVFLARESATRFDVAAEDLKSVPGSPIAYWISASMRNYFTQGVPLGDIALAAVGLQTGDNERFMRRWFEVGKSRISFNSMSRDEAQGSGMKWFPSNKGGEFRRWYGNHEYIVNWEDDGRDIRRFGIEEVGRPRSRPQNADVYFRPSVSWSDVTTGPVSFRLFPAGFIHDAVGHSAFGGDTSWKLRLLAYCNTYVFQKAVQIVNPTIHFHIGYFNKLPMIDATDHHKTEALANRCVAEARADWDAYERSWNFSSSPLISPSSGPDTPSIKTLKSKYSDWVAKNHAATFEMKRLEEEGNRVFAKASELQGESPAEVPIEQITLTVNPAYRYGADINDEEQWARFQRDSMAEFLSYATGCMMGRYSLDQAGLILADARETQAEQLAAYESQLGKPLGEVQFKPDPDGIIPVLDAEWFEDDIVARTREFLEVTFPESTVTENLRFIEESLGKDIRKYFCTDFYKDHLQTYKKRPIYWMVQSPKKGFACLIYLHRYTPDTLLQVLNNYFRPYLQKLEARLAQLGLDQLNDSLPTRERTAARKEAEKITKVLKECQAWEQDALLPLAQQRIELDLDDGVKMNYLKLKDVLAAIPGLAAKED
jgi:type II restriction/modification system DNA methylase subunit YeeA